MVATVTRSGTIFKNYIPEGNRYVRVSFTVALVETGLIPALAAAAKKARVDADVSRGEVAVKVGKTEDTIRLFESARTFVALNDLLEAYEETTGTSLLDLLDEARATLKKNG
jgi:ribosome-binding protein aMBF1 (putative translation factor)